jgi:hypothetical protein
VLGALHRSGLIDIGTSFPLLRDPGSTTYPQHGRVVSLSDAGLELLIRRNKARDARGMWALIDPKHRSTEAPPLLDGDPGQRRPESVEVDGG